MKKLSMALALMLGFVAVSSAQTATQKTSVKPAPAAKVAPVQKTNAATSTATKPAVKTATVAKTNAAATKVKADGTPDKRYKENKTTAKPATGPTKADGTADMRYKANKTAKGKG